MSVDDVGETVGYRELEHLIFGLLKQTGSHLSAELRGQRFAMSAADYAQWFAAKEWLRRHIDADEYPDGVALLDPRAVEQAPQATPDEYAAAEAHLAAHSAF